MARRVLEETPQAELLTLNTGKPDDRESLLLLNRQPEMRAAGVSEHRNTVVGFEISWANRVVRKRRSVTAPRVAAVERGDLEPSVRTRWTRGR